MMLSDNYWEQFSQHRATWRSSLLAWPAAVSARLERSVPGLDRQDLNTVDGQAIAATVCAILAIYSFNHLFEHDLFEGAIQWS